MSSACTPRPVEMRVQSNCHSAGSADISFDSRPQERRFNRTNVFQTLRAHDRFVKSLGVIIADNNVSSRFAIRRETDYLHCLSAISLSVVSGSSFSAISLLMHDRNRYFLFRSRSFLLRFLPPSTPRRTRGERVFSTFRYTRALSLSTREVYCVAYCHADDAYFVRVRALDIVSPWGHHQRGRWPTRGRFDHRLSQAGLSNR